MSEKLSKRSLDLDHIASRKALMIAQSVLDSPASGLALLDRLEVENGPKDGAVATVDQLYHGLAQVGWLFANALLMERGQIPFEHPER